MQVYFAPADPTQPVRLVGWAAADVAPGAATQVPVHCDPRALRRWDTAAQAWTPLGTGELLIARGLGDVRLRLPLT